MHTMTFFLLLYAAGVGVASAVNFVLPIPDRLGLLVGNENYRISLDPAVGTPAPPPDPAKNKRNSIYVTGALPGAKYEVTVHYTNSSMRDVAVWRGVAHTPPNPPTKLMVGKIKDGRVANVSWLPPKYGLFSSYLVTLYNVSARAAAPLQNISLTKDITSCLFVDLVPGGSYAVHVRTTSRYSKGGQVLSETALTGNFTLRPNPPGKFIVYFRNETTLAIMWHPSSLQTIFTGYKAFVMPPGAGQSVVFTNKSSNALEAVFTSLVPGRPYNIYVQTASGDEYSSEVVDQYRTAPLPPVSLNYDKDTLTSRSVLVRWRPPGNACEFDSYKISTSDWSIAPVIKGRNESTSHELNDDAFLPGRLYQISVKTLSAKVDSRPVSLNVTFRPLPVSDLQSVQSDEGNLAYWSEESVLCTITWRASNDSYQHLFKILYFEVDFENGDGNVTFVEDQERRLDTLLMPGRNYCISVQAVSHGVMSDRVITYQLTRPSKPLIEEFVANQSDFSITWRSFVGSRQKYYVVDVESDDDPLARSRTVNTTKTMFTMSGLYPGAVYDISVTAISQHGLKSAPEERKHVVNPLPPHNLTIGYSNLLLSICWRPPTDTIFSSYFLAYRIGDEESTWRGETVMKANTTATDIKKVITGEEYHVRVNTITYNGVKSLRSAEASYTVPPSAVTNVVNFEGGANSTIIILSFERPPGRIDYYEVVLIDSNGRILTENVTSDDYLYLNTPRITLKNLKPGTGYRLNLTCVSRSLRSAPANAHTRLKPLIMSEMEFVRGNDELISITSLTLRYTPTPLTATYFDEYRFQISPSNSLVQRKSADDDDRNVTFDNLTPGKEYAIKMWTVADGVLSARSLEARERLPPAPVNHLYAKTITDRSVELTWNEPAGEYDDFEVQHSAADTPLGRNITREPYFVFNALQPHRRYTFAVTVRSGTRNSSSILRRSQTQNATFTTRESIPGRIEQFRAIRVEPSEIEFAWHLADESRNGVLLRYFLTYSLENASEYIGVDIAPTHARTIVRELDAGKKYVFKIRAETKVGFGPSAEWTQDMPIWAPPLRPSSGLVPRQVGKGERSLVIQFDRDFFSEKNGPVKLYTIIVAEDVTRNISYAPLPSWFAVQLSSSKWAPYQAVDLYNPFANDNVANFTIGEQACLEQHQSGYCNGPLKSGSTYYVKIRAFTTPDKYTDTDYSLPMTTKVDDVLLARTLIKRQILENISFIGIVTCCLVGFLVCLCERTSKRIRRRSLSRNEIRRIGRQVIHSASVSSDTVVAPPPQHPFTKRSEPCSQQLPRVVLSDQRMRLQMKVLLHEGGDLNRVKKYSLPDCKVSGRHSVKSETVSKSKSVGREVKRSSNTSSRRKPVMDTF